MRTVLLLLFSICGIVALADDAVSPVFTFDARYQPSGVTPNAWVAYEAEGLSSRFSAATVESVVDDNGNGIPDSWEAICGLAGANAAADADPDGDGRTNLEEYNAGTNPIVAEDWMRGIAESGDSFVTDTRVIYMGGNPIFDETFAVVRVSNGFVCDTGGLYYDWDGDGIPNWWEARFSRSGSKTGLLAEADDDGDGFSNYGEFVTYTNPTNGMSKFIIGLEHITVEPTRSKSTVVRQLLNVGSTTSDYQLVWQSATGRTYSIYCISDLKCGFGDTPLAEIEGTGDEIRYSPSVSGDALFFNVKVRLAK